jgi:hypothetical protein
MLGDSPGSLLTKRLHARGRRALFREGASGKFLLDRARM